MGERKTAAPNGRVSGGKAAVSHGRAGGEKPAAPNKPAPNKRVNLVIGIVLVLLVVGGFVVTKLIGSGAGAPQVVIRDATGAEQTLPLNKDTELTVSTDLGWNHIVIENGTVRVDAADCKNQVCVEKGAISAVGEQIVCLPHKLVVSVVQEGKAAEYDVIGS